MPLIGRSPATRELRQLLARLVETDLPVLISGPAGAGKGFVARALHDRGKRRHGPFVPVDMAATPRELVASELFGHENGALADATPQGAGGKFGQAEGGTLFLDEIGDMPPEAQTRLLRALQQGGLAAGGDRRPTGAGARIVAATRRNLRRLVRRGLFREDLFHRLNAVPARLPPLGDRVEDIPDLVHHFLDVAANDGSPRKTISAEALRLLESRSWPGNVRELENVVRRLAAPGAEGPIDAGAVRAALAPDAEVDAGAWREPDGPADADSFGESVKRHLDRYFAAHGEGLPPDGLYDRVIEEIERPLIAMCLNATRGNQVRAARLLGIHRNTLRKKIGELQIPVVRRPQ